MLTFTILDCRTLHGEARCAKSAENYGGELCRGLHGAVTFLEALLDCSRELTDLTILEVI